MKRKRNEQPEKALMKFSTAIALVETISLAMRTHEDLPEFGPIAAAVEVACRKLHKAYEAVDRAFMGVRP
jgi:hypothetical protein